MNILLPTIEVLVGHPDPEVTNRLQQAIEKVAVVTCVNDPVSALRHIFDRQGLLTIACLCQSWLEDNNGELLTALDTGLHHPLALSCILAPYGLPRNAEFARSISTSMWLVRAGAINLQSPHFDIDAVLQAKADVESRRKMLKESMCALQGAESLTCGGHIMVPRQNASTNHAADLMECRLIHWIEEEFACPVIACSTSFANFWTFAPNGLDTDFILVANGKNTSPNSLQEKWLLRIEELEPFELVPRVARNFREANRLLRPGIRGRTRLQFKASELLPDSPLAGYGTLESLGLPSLALSFSLDELRLGSELPEQALPHADLPLHHVGATVLATLLGTAAPHWLQYVLAETIRRLSDVDHPPPLGVAAEWLSRIGRIPQDRWPEDPSFSRCVRVLQSYWRMRAQVDGQL